MERVDGLGSDGPEPDPSEAHGTQAPSASALRWARAPSALLAVSLACGAISGTAGCKKGHAAAPRPDLSGVWDVAYDDFLDAELRVGHRVHRARLGPLGGRLVASVAGVAVVLGVDCTRDEVVCPNEIWPSELPLTNRMGDLDDQGEQLSISLAGEGHGPCVLASESGLGARVESVGSARDGNWQATALSRGRVTTVVSSRCLGAPPADGREEVWVTLSTGLSAVRR